MNFFAQNVSELNSKNSELAPCHTSEAMKWLYENNPSAKKEMEAFEIYTENFVKQHQVSKGTMANCYVIPVVFHVYGTTQSGKTINNPLIINALAKLNDDFKGLNADYNTVHNTFMPVRAAMPDITFALAQLDPNGNATTGIVYYPAKAGYGNSSGYDTQIAADAWDNYKYMNVYIQNDLYNNSVFTNSGIAWYPNTTMSTNKTARVVYNGAYIGTNTSTEFASVLTHEFGHWMNLIHTFEGGCVPPNDNVADTPPCDYSGASYTCHATSSANYPLNCNNNLINAENYMDYSGAYGCYKMFTQGQTARVYAAMAHPARQPLWQTSNLVATGLSSLCSSSGLTDLLSKKDLILIAPNPAQDILNVTANGIDNGEYHFVLTNLVGQELLKEVTEVENNILQKQISVAHLPIGVYLLTISNGETSVTKKISKVN